MRRAILLLTFALLLTAWTTTASAQDYWGASELTLQQALSSAQASPEDDKITLLSDAGFWSDVSPSAGFTYNGPSAATSGKLEIVGGGPSSVVYCSPNLETAMTIVAAPGSSIHGLSFKPDSSFGCKNYSKLLAASNVDVYDASFDVSAKTTAIRALDGGPVSIRRTQITGDQGDDSVGVAAADAAEVSADRLLIRDTEVGVTSRESANLQLRNSLIDLGTTAALGNLVPTGVLLANDPSNAHAEAELSNVTIVGSGSGQRAAELFSHGDYTSQPYPWIHLHVSNSILAVTGSGSRDISCPNFSNDYSDETVVLDHVASNPSTFTISDCPTLTNTNAVNSATSPLLLAADRTPMAGSSAIDAGDPGFVPAGGELDLAGNARVFGSAVDLGAYEFGSSPPGAGGGPGGNPGDGNPGAAPAITAKFGKAVGKFKIAKKAKSLRKGKKRSKPRIPITLSARSTVTFKLAQVAKSKKKKTVKGTLKLTLPAGRSYLTWNGKWGKKKLRPGRYILSAAASGQTTPTKLNLKFSR
jgi:hypothetical protein